MTTTTAAAGTANLAGITTTASAQAAAAAAKSATMGKSDFLKLFTTQLKNQDPTDPVKNEAFVAQLAQFSQLEATTTMADSLSQMVSSMQGDRMMSAAALIGKSVTAPGISAVLSKAQPVNSVINLPNGADSVQIDIYDASGKNVRSGTLGAQVPGQSTFTWDGTDNSGNTLPDGAYSFIANAISAGTASKVTVSTTGIVTSVSSDPASKAMILQVNGSGSIPLSTVTSVGN